MSAEIRELRLPDFGLSEQSVRLSAWLVSSGGAVSSGERVVELAAGDVIVDLNAPVDGVLCEQCVEVDDLVDVGRVLARFRAVSR